MSVTFSQIVNALQRPLNLVLNAGGALIIGYLFILVLMVATAESGVSVRLASRQSKLDYSSARALVSEAKLQRARALELRDMKSKATLDLQLISDREIKTHNEFLAASGPLEAILESRGKLGKCKPFIPVSGGDNDKKIISQVASLKECIRDESLPPSTMTEINKYSLLKEYDNSLQEWRMSSAAFVSSNTRLQRIETELGSSSLLISPDEAVAESSLQEFGSLDKPWLIGGVALADFPPALLQIILGFIAGLFGALLITLVLIVYPQSGYTMSSGGYGARIFLGGLIAVCVFVVLNGGETVLGTTSFQAGQANYMTFSAAGILSGMFSDRVAAWLSASATSFFKSGSVGQTKLDPAAVDIHSSKKDDP